MSGKMITTELYSHLLIETVCSSKDLLSTIISFITSLFRAYTVHLVAAVLISEKLPHNMRATSVNRRFIVKK